MPCVVHSQAIQNFHARTPLWSSLLVRCTQGAESAARCCFSVSTLENDPSGAKLQKEHTQGHRDGWFAIRDFRLRRTRWGSPCLRLPEGTIATRAALVHHNLNSGSIPINIDCIFSALHNGISEQPTALALTGCHRLSPCRLSPTCASRAFSNAGESSMLRDGARSFSFANVRVGSRLS
jgi:hypothetical protein